jgi:hypothetical protein
VDLHVLADDIGMRGWAASLRVTNLIRPAVLPSRLRDADATVLVSQLRRFRYGI